MPFNENYVPARVPLEAGNAMRNFLSDELDRIAEMFNAPFLFLQPTFAEPKNAITGMIAYADGTQWNPGAGEGAYIYQFGGWSLIDSAKGYGGFDIANTPQVFNATSLFQIINVYQRRLPANRPAYGCLPDIGASNITVTQGGYWHYHINYSVQVPDAEILIFGIFADGVLVFEVELENTNQIDFESGVISGTGEVPQGTVIDLRLRTDSGPATITFIHLIFDIDQVRSPL
mgnify:CR=1 FL=1